MLMLIRFFIGLLLLPLFAIAAPEMVTIRLDDEPAVEMLMPETEWLQRRIFFNVGARIGDWEMGPAERAVVLGAKQYVQTNSALPNIDFGDPVATRILRGSDFKLDVKFYNEAGERVEAFDLPGIYGAEIACTFDSGHAYAVRRNFFRLPDGSTLADTSEDTALKLAADQRLGRTWTSADKPPAALAEYWWHGIYKKEGRTLHYRTIDVLPKGYNDDPEKRWPTIIDLHGVGGTWLSYDKLSADPFFDVFTNRDRFLIVAPHTTLIDWQAPALEDLIDELVRERRADPNRIYLMGHSMGGSGVWKAIQSINDRFAAAAIFSGYAPKEDLEPRIGDFPLWVVCGGKDNPIYLETCKVQEKMRKAKGFETIFIYEPEWNHMDVRNKGYADDRLYDWFLEHRKSLQKRTD
jgi:predicted esterase